MKYQFASIQSKRVVAVLGIGFLLALGFLIWILLYARSFVQQSCDSSLREITRSSLPLKLKWQYSAPDCFGNFPIYHNGQIIGRTNQSLILLEAHTGNELLNLATGSIGTTPGIAAFGNLLVYTSDAGKRISVLDMQRLDVVWSQSPGGWLDSGARGTAIDASGVYVASGVPGGRVSGYAPKTGELLWQNPNVGGSWGSGLTIQKDSLVLFVRASMYRLDKQTGKVAAVVEDRFFGSRSEIVGDTVYLFQSQRLAAQELDSGHLKWEFRTTPYGLVSHQEKIILATQQGNRGLDSAPALYALDAVNGQLEWKHEMEHNPISDPIVIGVTGYIVLSDASILAFDIYTGTTVGVLKTTPSSASSSLLASGLATDGACLYATFGDKQLFAFC